MPTEALAASDNFHKLMFRYHQPAILGRMLGLNDWRGIKSTEALEKGTPFFWRSLIGKSTVEPAIKDDDEVLSASLLFFDSFFNELPVGAAVAPKPASAKIIHLPKLGVKLATTQSARMLRKVSSFGLQIQTEAGLCEVLVPQRNSELLLSIEHQHQITEKYILTSLGSDLADQQSMAAVDRLTNIKEFSSQLADALDWIATAPNDLSDEIIKKPIWFVPISTEKPDVHKSFTAPDLKRVVFASYAADPHRLAEAIIHEVAHSYLNRAADVDLLVRPDMNWVYSPWRDDSRPVIGLLHALYVFAMIGRFLNSWRLPASATGWVTRRRQLILARLILGLKQIEVGMLSELGQRIIMRISELVRCDMHETKIDAEIWGQVRSHAEAWQSRYPKLHLYGGEIEYV